MKDRLRLVNYYPLTKKIDYTLEDDTLDLANVRGLEGMIFTFLCFLIVVSNLKSS